MKNKLFLSFIFLTSSVILSGCTPPVRPQNIQPMSTLYSEIDHNDSLNEKITLGTITLAEHVNHSPIPMQNSDLATPIKQALQGMGYLAKNEASATYVLNATLTQLDTPYFGFNMTTHSTVNYTLLDTKTKQTVWSHHVFMAYEAAYSESLFDGEERLRISIEKSLRENITHMLRLLAQVSTPKDSKHSAH